MHRRQILQWFSLGWIASFLPWKVAPFGLDTKALAVSATDVVLDKIRKINDEFRTIGIYHRPNDQDRASAGSGEGIYPCSGKLPCTEKDNRSEKIYLPFVMATRRQTDSMVRQAYLLLPENIRRDTAFLITDRLIQYPEEYIPYIQKKKNIVLIGSFFGIGDINNREKYNETDDGTGTKTFHRLQLRQLEYSVDLVKSLGKNIVDIVYAMGDSLSPYAEEIREELEGKVQNILSSRSLNFQNAQVDWGADDTTLKAFARQLPELRLKVEMANPKAKHHYDAYQTTNQIIDRVTNSLGVNIGNDDIFDVQAFIFDRYLGAPSDFNKGFSPNNPKQKQLDKNFRQKINNISKNQHSKSIIIDGRNPNGALNTDCLPLSDKFLAFGSWGTFSNTCTQTLAIAKILHFANKPDLQRQLLLEAVTHDVFIIGYKEAQDTKLPSLLRQRLSKKNLRYTHKEPPYTDAKETAEAFRVINDFVNQRMSEAMPGVGDTKFTVVPQLWRTFESQVFASDGELSIAGVYREDLPPEIFNPSVAARNVKKFNLNELINEFS